MSYEQALKHSKNHRKDRFVQQCSGYGGDGKPMYPPVTQEQENEESKRSMTRMLLETHVYPIWLHQTQSGRWELVSSKHLFGTQVNSFDELMKFAKDYADVSPADAIEQVENVDF